MCGICGFNWQDSSLIQRMIRSLSHRGPDASGRWVDSQMSLGHTRLAILDLSSKGKNPMASSDNDFFIVYNGEVYNYKELRRDLETKGYGFNSETDTEVILNSYIEYGPKALQKLNGMFSFAIWDAKKKELFLARDRLGIKPLYYYYNPLDQKFIFASEIKAILEHDVPREVSNDALNAYLSFRFTPGANTMLKSIYKLEPGSYLTLSKDKLNITKYWHLKERISQGSLSQKSKQLRCLLESSIKYRMISDVPLGAYLSGGLDSSLIAALMAQSVNEPLKTFSVGFEHSTDTEIGYAKTVADHIGSDHHEILVTGRHLKQIPDMVYHLDEPVGDAATLPTKIISQFAKKKVTVALAGEGADELFAGYDRYKIGLTANSVRRFSPPALARFGARLMNSLGKSSNSKRISSILSSKTNALAYFNLICLMDDKEKNTLLPVQNRIDPKSKTLKKHYEDFKSAHHLSKMLNFDINTVLCNDFFLKADKMTMAHAIEERVPILDHRIAEFSMTLRPSYKLNKGVGKYLLRRAVKDLIPREIIKRRKHGYDAPMDNWLKKDLYSQASSLFEDASHSLYQTQKLSELLRRFKKSKSSYKGSWFESQKIWSMYMFELWHKIYIEKEKLQGLRI